MDYDGTPLPDPWNPTRKPAGESPGRESGGRLRFAKRMDVVGGSGIRELLDRGRRIPDAIDLSMGQADFEVPDPLKEATINAVRGQCGRYSGPQGYPELVAATKRHVQQRYGLADDEEVMMTVGTSGAITLALLALVGPGDEVLVPDPHFVIYPNLVHVAGATPVYYDLYPDLRLRIERIEECITERTRLLILNTPANPTGGAFTPDELKAVAELSRARQLPVLSDELYEVFAYDAPHVSIKHFLGWQSLLVSGFSKTYGLAGWRLGWAAGDPELIDKMRTLQLFAYVCPPTLVQKGALAAFEVDMSATVESYRHKRDLLYEGLVGCGYEVIKPAGSFFAFPRVPWGDDLEFCEHALAEKLLVLPGRAFSRCTTHFRLSFAASDETIERALEVLARIARRP
ncbi:MAG: pyridoxal phosphate-dependent aminotransferase [bacterium]|nr:pyridoxal phosphate-dependent aminotransferase [bacterium]